MKSLSKKASSQSFISSSQPPLSIRAAREQLCVQQNTVERSRFMCSFNTVRFKIQIYHKERFMIIGAGNCNMQLNGQKWDLFPVISSGIHRMWYSVSAGAYARFLYV